MKLNKDIKTNEIYKLDQFFTKKEIALQCLKELKTLYKLNSFDCIIEPSAGEGSFVKILPKNTIAIEIDSTLCFENPNYICQDFLNYEHNENEKVLVIGNPPFGTQNSLSVSFFNHAALFADTIAFIIPKTWKKQSIHNRLDKNFSLIKSIDLQEDCFYGDKDTNVKCCFQIWQKSNKIRTIEKKVLLHKDWDFLSYIKTEEDLIPPKEADFVILAYGSNSGQISSDLFNWRPKSVHFIKAKIDKDELIKNFNSLDYSCANDSARQSSLCKTDLIKLYSEKYGS